MVNKFNQTHIFTTLGNPEIIIQVIKLRHKILRGMPNDLIQPRIRSGFHGIVLVMLHHHIMVKQPIHITCRHQLWIRSHGIVLVLLHYHITVKQPIHISCRHMEMYQIMLILIQHQPKWKLNPRCLITILEVSATELKIVFLHLRKQIEIILTNSLTVSIILNQISALSRQENLTMVSRLGYNDYLNSKVFLRIIYQTSKKFQIIKWMI